MRQFQISALLEHAKRDLANIEKQYNNSLHKRRIAPSLQIDIKNFMENLRSALDFMAKDIYEEVISTYRQQQGKKPLSNTYFPYGKTKNEFMSSLGRSLPELDKLNPKVFSLIESIQPYSSKNMWLYQLCNLVNANKHDSLTPQTKKQRDYYNVGLRNGGPSISAPAGAIRAPPGAIRIGTELLVFDPITGIPYSTKHLEVKVTTWVSFYFSGTTIDVFSLLKKSLTEIETFSKKLYKLI